MAETEEQEERDDGLNTLFPERELRLDSGDTVHVKPLMFMQLPQGAAHIDGILRAALRSGLLNEEGDLNLSNLSALYAEAGEHVNELILMCTYLDGQLVDRDWLAGASVEDGLELMAAVVEANWRESIVKKLNGLAARMTTSLGGTGRSLSTH